MAKGPRPLSDGGFRAAVVGAGLMGHGIAHVLAQRAGSVTMYDISQEALELADVRVRDTLQCMVEHGIVDQAEADGIAGRIRGTTDLAEAVEGASVVVEASPEDMELKRRLFTELERLVSPDTVLASNTSGMSIGDMTGHLAHQERVVGSHFFLPAQVIPLVEVLRGPRTTDETMDRTIELWQSCGKRPIRIEKDVNGYVANRLQAALVREATNLVAEGVASAADIDLAVKTSFGLRFMVSGPLEQRDLGGLDLHVALARGLWPHLSTSNGPFPYVADMVERGDLGLKSGRGFFDWSGRDPEEVRRERTTQMIEVMSRLEMWPESSGAGHGKSQHS